MDPERWRQIERLSHAALARPGEERGTYLTLAAGDDEESRREVERLLNAPVTAKEFLPVPATAGPGNTMLIGDSLGLYRLLELIGAGLL